MRLYWWEIIVVSHHPTKFGTHKQGGSKDTMFSVIEEQDATWSLLNLALLSIYF